MNEFSMEQDLPANVRRHRPRRRALGTVSGLLLVGTIAAACGSGSGSGSPPAGGGGSSGVTVEAKTTSLGMVLTNSKGFTLYRLNKDSMNHSNCDSACLQTWPPLLVTGGSPVAGSGVSGLGTINVAAGKQVTYHGMPLYTFTGDSSAGQTNGQNVTDQWGTWFVITTQAAPAGGGSTTTTTTGGTGGGGPAF